MKFLILLILVLAGGYMFPQVYEQVDGPCQSVEKKLVRDNTENGLENSIISNVALAISNGDLGERIADDKFPNLPSRLGCLAVYYNMPEGKS
ncbi:hypothetical protein A9Q96_05270 [Rhodobacterales bacterium 52_120_T64]|nr:hypothetical protein A9Q96_05270 [Rhodobacterales bacterium 52_120_T64]